MICYKDKTFCDSDCMETSCWRYFSEAEAEGAKRWWSHDPENAPVAWSDFSKSCPYYKPGRDN